MTYTGEWKLWPDGMFLSPSKQIVLWKSNDTLLRLEQPAGKISDISENYLWEFLVSQYTKVL